jgi:hypothetical protein
MVAAIRCRAVGPALVGALAMSGPAPGRAQDAGPRVGTRVVTKPGTVPKVGDRVVDDEGRVPLAGGGERRTFRVYRVEREGGR